MEEDLKNLEKIKLETVIRNSKWTNYTNLGKIIVPFILGSLLLFFVQKPESILNRKQSDESINRERAKLVLNLINKKDNDDILLGLDIIEVSYPENDKWIKDVKEIFQLRKENQVFNSVARDKLDGLRLKQLNSLNNWYDIKEATIRYKAFSKDDNSIPKFASMTGGFKDSLFKYATIARQIPENVIDKKIASKKRSIIEYLNSLEFSGMPNSEHEEH